MIVFIEGRKIEIKEPSSATLKKYGLALNDWKEILAQQNYRCPICLNILDKTINIEHYHARHWKKMTPENRKKYVRGITDWFCNKNYLSKGITVEKARRLVIYLERFEKRKPNAKKT